MMTGDPDEDKPGERARIRTMTERGREYQLDIRERERHRVMKRLETKTKELKELLSGEYEVKFVRSQYSKWLRDYELLLVAHDEFQRLLNPETASQDKQLFQNQSASFLKVKNEAENWLLTAKPYQEYDTKSHSSRGSNTSSVSSQVSIERMKEEQKKAEHIAQQVALKEKQRLQQERFKLEQQEEELDLETELKLSDAKSKILEDLERSMAQDSDIFRLDAQPLLKQVNKNIDKMSPHATEHSSNSNNDSVGILTVSRELNKPKAEISKFHGSALDYTCFKRQFNARICQNTDSFDERLNYLLQFTSGEAYKIVVGYSNLPAEAGYRAAFEEFEERYGDSELIAQSYVKKVVDWPSIKPDDPKALDDFVIFLRECQYAVDNVDAARVLEYSDNLRSIVQKLPYYLHDKWRNTVYEQKSKGIGLNIKTLVTFIRKEARKATDPIYGKVMLINKQAKPTTTSTRGS